MPSPLNRGLLLFWRKLMSEDLPVNRMSFRADKQTELLNLKKNQFGHTVASESSDESTTDNVKLRFGGSGTGRRSTLAAIISSALSRYSS
jgi:hypothetical protein